MELVFLILIFIIGYFLVLLIFPYNSPIKKGRLGERATAKVLHQFFKDQKAVVFNDITLKSINDSTQIDHVVVSTKGIFVVETKNHKGWIFGNAKNRYWTQVIFNSKTQFQNPIRQNYKHIKFLEEQMKVSPDLFYTVVVFMDHCEFKTRMPDYVVKLQNLVFFLTSFTTDRITEADLDLYVNQLKIISNNKKN